MKATGIVRRIDDLGRVVIPKEIRRTMRIREGDPLEIYTDREGEVIFKKYSPMGELQDAAGQLTEALWRESACACAICDRDTVVATGGIKGEGKALTAAAEKAMEQPGQLRGCEVHSSVILSPVDEKVFKRLGVNLTCQPRYKG